MAQLDNLTPVAVPFREGEHTSEPAFLNGAAILRVAVPPSAKGSAVRLLHGLTERGHFGPGVDIRGEFVMAALVPGSFIMADPRIVDGNLWVRLQTLDEAGQPVAQDGDLAFTIIAPR